MEVQPQVVLLQKTLLNIEGLGRQLYPDLDLWETAHPYLERWLKKRFHPKTLFEEFKRYAPEWAEKLPEVPSIILNNLSNFEKLGKMTPQLEQVAEDYQHAKATGRKRYMRRVTAAILGVTAVVIAWPQGSATIAGLPTLSLAAGAIAIGLWLFK